MELPVHVGKGTDSRRRRRKIKPVKQSFKHQRILLEMTRRKSNFMMITQFHRKHLMLLNSKYEQHAENWIRVSKAQDQGLEFWQTKSFAIMTCATIPGDCIDHVRMV